MNLSDEQKTAVTKWIAEGLKLSEIQTRLGKDFGLNLTYMEVRFLVDDLKVMPKDPEPAKTPEPAKDKGQDSASEDLAEADLAMEAEPEMPEPPSPLGSGKVSVTTDTVTVPGAMASGKVTFSDGQTAQWYLDQYGRLGLATQTKGYRPSPADVQAFQTELEKHFRKFGM